MSQRRLFIMSPDQKLKQDTRQSLHRMYQELTGLTVSYLQREFAWAEWMNRGLDENDLRRWINYIRGRINKGQLDWRSLQFTNLIGNMDRAEESCIELRRQMRGRKPETPREEILRSAGLTKTANTDTSHSISEVIQKVVSDPEAAARAFKELQKLKQSL